MTPSAQQVSQLLMAWREGDPEAFDRLMPMVYDELRRLAHRYMKRVPEARLYKPRRWYTKPTCALLDTETLTGRTARTFSQFAHR